MRSWKPRARIRAESVGWGEGVVPPQGSITSTVAPDPDEDHYAAMLYLPDPESRTGWQLHGVERKKDDPTKSPLGFGRGG